MKRLSARPHHVGSPYDKENAEWILARFKEWGWDAHMENFYVLFPTPKERLVELVEPTKFTAKLEEPTVPEDPTSSQHDEQLPTYNAYSADGTLQGRWFTSITACLRITSNWSGWGFPSKAPLLSCATGHRGGA
jgi:N-acetylated-alpha-linked acidic dipeptidase